jgi:hypothetical protein
MPAIRAKDKPRQHLAKPYERKVQSEVKEHLKIHVSIMALIFIFSSCVSLLKLLTQAPVLHDSSNLHQDNFQERNGFFSGIIAWLSPWKKRGSDEVKIDDCVLPHRNEANPSRYSKHQLDFV